MTDATGNGVRAQHQPADGGSDAGRGAQPAEPARPDVQDVRGKHGSEGDYVMSRPLRGPLNPTDVDHATDTWDTIDWLVKNVRHNNGKVGVWGISYPGFYVAAGMIDALGQVQ